MLSAALRPHLQRGLRPDGDRLLPARQPARARQAPVPGHPDAGCGHRASSIPDTLRELPVGEVGELVTHAPQVMVGYWRNPQADREAFFELDGKRFFRTGDLAFDGRGRLLLHARPPQAHDQHLGLQGLARGGRKHDVRASGDPRGLRDRACRMASAARPSRRWSCSSPAPRRGAASRTSSTGRATAWRSTRRRAWSSSSTACRSPAPARSSGASCRSSSVAPPRSERA